VSFGHCNTSRELHSPPFFLFVVVGATTHIFVLVIIAIEAVLLGTV
jgi:hypothetical protein